MIFSKNERKIPVQCNNHKLEHDFSNNGRKIPVQFYTSSRYYSIIPKKRYVTQLFIDETASR